MNGQAKIIAYNVRGTFENHIKMMSILFELVSELMFYLKTLKLLVLNVYNWSVKVK